MSIKLVDFSHLLHATKYSLIGLRQAFRSEQSFRHELIILLILIALLWLQKKESIYWIMILSSWLFVMIIELINSAIEKVFDLITTGKNSVIKMGKDIASAASFLAIIMNIMLWCYVFIFRI